MLIITGTQRSGTTFTAQFLYKCGLEFDNNMDWDETITGGFDSLDVDRFFREYIGDETFSYDDIDKMQKDSSKKIKPSIFPKGEVFKVAYLLQNPIFIHIIHKFRGKQDKWLILNRNKEDVWATKQRRWDRFKHDSLLLKQSVEELEINFNKSLKIIETYGYDYEMLYFPKILNSFKRFSKKLLNLGYDIRDKEHIWNKLVDFDKVHHGCNKLKRKYE